MTALPRLEDLGELRGRSVLVRVDFNVPLADGKITDDLRIRSALPTLRWLQQQGAKVTAITHLGRPHATPAGASAVGGSAVGGSAVGGSAVGGSAVGGSAVGGSAVGGSAVGGSAVGTTPADATNLGSSQSAGLNTMSAESSMDSRETYMDSRETYVDSHLSTVPLQRRLNELLPGVQLKENLRFHPGEIANDPDFAADLAAGHDAYVNDAFGASHRAHASIVGPPRFLPSAAGRLLAREVEVLGGLRASPRRPFVAVLGGSKVSDKLGVIKSLLEIVDSLVIGGGMCFTFLKAQGRSIGASLCEDAMLEQCRRLLDGPLDIHLPCDITALSPAGVLGDPSCGGEVRQMGLDLPDSWIGTDIGPGSAAAFEDVIHDAGTVLWNGPMGVFEDPRFASGTAAVATTMSQTRAFTVVGGGDSAAAVRQLGLASEMDHVSTGGGSALELIEKGDLPGLGALRGAVNVT